MKVVFILTIIGLLMGCENPYKGGAGQVSNTSKDAVVHTVLDHKRQVTCYVYSSAKKGGIHCFTADQLPFQEN